MINIVGAFIISILIFAILREGPRFSSVNENFENLSVSIHLMLILFLILLLYQTCHYSSVTSYEITLINIPYLILDGFNFWIHEAGHAYCMFFGELLHFLGGTLFQLALPSFLFIRAIRNDYYLFSSVFLFWIGQNMPGIGIYIGDARLQKLPLAGGGEHDWAFILKHLGLLKYDTIFGDTVYYFGIIIMTISLIYYLFFLLKKLDLIGIPK
jgi:hypothetical protein